MQEYKIDVRALTEQQKKDVQDAFFKLGYSWGTDSEVVLFLDKDYYYAEGDGGMTYGITWEVYCNNSNYTKITYKDLMTLAYGDSTMKAFTKADLKDGMFVRLTNGNIYLKVKGNLFSHCGFMELCCYDENLNRPDKNWSVAEVMEIAESAGDVSLGFEKMDKFNYRSIWKRSEQTEQQKQLVELKAAQEELLLKAQEINDKIVAMQQGC